jgi:hypothetical protein
VRYQRAVEMFIQLHGDMVVADIKKTHARTFREALQEVPRTRGKELHALSFPELAAYGRQHPEVRKVTAKTVNKQFGGVQAVALWAADNGMVPDDVDWVDPFARMRLDEDEPEREPFSPGERSSQPPAPSRPGREGHTDQGVPRNSASTAERKLRLRLA